MNDTHLSKVDKRAADAGPNIAGRALDSATTNHVMIAAPRRDDVAAVDDAGLAAAVGQIAAQWTQAVEHIVGGHEFGRYTSELEDLKCCRAAAARH